MLDGHGLRTEEWPCFTESISHPELSVVAPMYNEEGNIAAFVAAVEAAVSPIGVPFEIVLVDDGSSDGTWGQIVEQSKLHSVLRGARLARNFGHQGALFAALSEARGKAVVSLDGDLQHPPQLIPDMFARWREGFKVVNTERADAEDTSPLKRATSRWLYGVFSKLTGVAVAPGNSDFRLLDESAVRALCEMQDVDLFIGGSVTWLGFRSATLPYRANKRFSGTTKSSLRKMLGFASGAILSFSLAPLRIGIWLGFLTSGLAVLELGYILFAYSQGKTITGWASVPTFVSLMFGILFVVLGIIGTYLGKIFELLKNRPLANPAQRSLRCAVMRSGNGWRADSPPIVSPTRCDSTARSRRGSSTNAAGLRARGTRSPALVRAYPYVKAL